MPNLKLTVEEIDAARSPRGGWTKATLAQWGVPWPAPKGWRKQLIRGTFCPQSVPDKEFQEKAAGWKVLTDIFRDPPKVMRIPVPAAIQQFDILNWMLDGGLTPIAVDKAGRLWRHDREKHELVMFFDPNRRWCIDASTLTDDDYLPDFATGGIVCR